MLTHYLFICFFCTRVFFFKSSEMAHDTIASTTHRRRCSLRRTLGGACRWRSPRRRMYHTRCIGTYHYTRPRTTTRYTHEKPDSKTLPLFRPYAPHSSSPHPTTVAARTAVRVIQWPWMFYGSRALRARPRPPPPPLPPGKYSNSSSVPTLSDRSLARSPLLKRHTSFYRGSFKSTKTRTANIDCIRGAWR